MNGAAVRRAFCMVLMSLGGVASGADPRLRSEGFDPERVYRLRGYVGFQIDLEFSPGERFVGLGAGDIDAVGYAAEDNHLFLKPRAAHVRTNLTVLTSRHTYHLDYRVVSADPPADQAPELVYTLKFIYPEPPVIQPSDEQQAEHALDAEVQASRNLDYWYCGSPGLRPRAVFDDGVSMHLQFDPRAELPALFVLSDDGSESLLNFSVHGTEIVVHRVARRLIVRRGGLSGCIVNRAFAGVGRELGSGTVNPQIERARRGGSHEQ